MLSSFCSAVARVPRAAAAAMQTARLSRPAAPAAAAAAAVRSFSSAPAAAPSSSQDKKGPSVRKQRKAEALAAAQKARESRALKPVLAAPVRTPLKRMRARVHRQGQAPPKPQYLTAQQHGQIMSRSFRGIFAGKHVHFGNMVSHSTRRTRRTWSPNVHRMAVVSEVLGRELTLQVSTAALRTFDKHGGMDRYLLRSRLDKLDQGLSRELRTACELTILNYPEVATQLHLEDVLRRVRIPSETKRLRAIEAERAAAVKAASEPGASPLPRLVHLARARDAPLTPEQAAAKEATRAADRARPNVQRNVVSLPQPHRGEEWGTYKRHKASAKWPYFIQLGKKPLVVEVPHDFAGTDAEAIAAAGTGAAPAGAETTAAAAAAAPQQPQQ